MIEQLEKRRFLSASVANGVLTVTGTDHADRINVVQRGAGIVVHEGKAVTRFGKNDHVERIVVNALGGNDRVTILSKLGATVDGGDGKDLIIGGAGSDVLLGGNGNDRILGQRGNDSIGGGTGHDVLFGGAGDDTIDAFDTEADQVGGGAGNDSGRVDSPTDTAWNIENYLTVTASGSGASAGTNLTINTGALDPGITKTGAGALILNGGALGGRGSITGAIDVPTSGHVLPGTGVGTLTLDSLNLEGSSVGLDRILISSNPDVLVGGYNTINFTDLGGVAAGDFVIIDYNNLAPIGSFNPLIMGDSALLRSLTATDSDQVIVLHLAPTLQGDSGTQTSEVTA